MDDNPDLNPDIGMAQPVWTRLKFEAKAAAADEPTLASYLNAVIMGQNSLCQALSFHMASKLAGAEMSALQVREVVSAAYDAAPALLDDVEADLHAVVMRDPAARGYLQPFLFFKGFLVLQSYRIAHYYWGQGREVLAFYFQSRTSELFGVDIHPAAVIGSGIMFDHATGITVGETARIGDGCSILHGVTLGGTGKDFADRHPKIGKGVLISVGAKVLGNIHVGDRAKIAAGSVVLKDVPEGATVAGVPAKIVGQGRVYSPAEFMDQGLPDGIE